VEGDAQFSDETAERAETAAEKSAKLTFIVKTTGPKAKQAARRPGN
jgi:hypothetical protein